MSSTGDKMKHSQISPTSTCISTCILFEK